MGDLAASTQRRSIYLLPCLCVLLFCFTCTRHLLLSLSNTHIRSFDSLIQSLVFQSQVGKLSSFQTKLQSVEGLPQNMCGGVSAVRYCDRADRGSKPFESFCTTQKFLCQHFALLFSFFLLYTQFITFSLMYHQSKHCRKLGLVFFVVCD